MNSDQLLHALTLYPLWLTIPVGIVVAAIALWLFVKIFKIMMWLSVISFVCIGGLVVFRLMNK